MSDLCEPGATVVRKSLAQLQTTRAALVKSAGMTEEELRARARVYQVAPAQRDIVDALDTIDYLLGNDGNPVD